MAMDCRIALCSLALSVILVPVPSSAQNALTDVRIGETRETLRIALDCQRACTAKSTNVGSILIEGLDESAVIDLVGRSQLAARLRFTPEGGATRMTIEGYADARAISSAPCGDELCLDVAFGGNLSQRATTTALASGGAAPQAPAPAHSPAPAPLLRDAGDPASIPVIGAAVAASESRLDLFKPMPGFPPAERLTPPADKRPMPVEIGRLVSTLPARIDAGRAQEVIAASFDLREEAETILGRSFDIGYCLAAEARLQSDPWALPSMVDTAFCKAFEGQLDTADKDFSRLLSYTPDNYEALIGRGLVAARKGDVPAARSFFQEALTALPPIAESNRIVTALQRL